MESGPPPPATLSYDSPARSDSPAATDQPTRLPRGTAVQRYLILERVGEGGMGVVYAAYDPVLDRRVALKFLAHHEADRSGVRERRLLREAQAMARLSHPNVVVAYEVGNFQGQVFIAMEFVEGVDLGTWLSQKPRTFSEIVEVFRAAGRGLAAAHAAGIIHRDFKPENVLVDRQGRTRVTDFGLSRALTDADEKDAGAADAHGASPLSSPSFLSRPLTRTHGLLGTPSYMSPEQLRGGTVDARADQYSFCVALYKAAYGELPFEGDENERRENALARGTAPAPAESAVPKWCRRALVRGLSPDPDDRFASMEALLDALVPPARRGRTIATVTALAILVAGAGTYAVLARSEAQAGEACPGAPDRVAQMWNPAARERMRSVFLATGKPNAGDVFARVVRALDGRAAAWQAAHIESCRATRVRGEQSEAMLDLRMQCLERARRQVQGLVSLWQESVDLNSAAEAALTAGDLRDCADTEALAAPIPPPRDQTVSRRLDEIRRKLDDIEARRKAGQLQPALVMARDAVAALRPLDYPPLLAEALQANGRFELEVGDLTTGLGLLREAFTEANAARDDARAVKVMVMLLFATGARAERFTEAASLWTFAEAALARVRDRDDLASDLLYARSAALNAQGRHSEAASFQERSLALARKAYEPDDVRLAHILNSLSVAKWNLGKPFEAETDSQQALAILEKWWGSEHPNTGRVVHNLCLKLGVTGEAERADTYCKLALADVERNYPGDHPQVSKTAHNVATVRLLQERNDEARALLDRAERIMEAAVGTNDPAMAMIRSVQAELALKLGEVDKAHRIMAGVLPVTIKAYGEDHHLLAERLTIWGDILLRKGDLVGARKAHQRALEIWGKLRPEHPQVGRSLSRLATVALAEGRHAAAIEKFEQARVLVEKGYGPQHPSVAAAMTGIGQAHLASGRAKAAVEVLERAVALMESKRVRLGEGDTRFQLAQALWANGQRSRARAMAERAHDAYARASIRYQASEVERWLRSRPGPRKPP